MKKVSVSAPCRIDLAGGTVDLWPLYLYMDSLELVNLAINIKATAEVGYKKNPRGRAFSFEISSADLGVSRTFNSLGELSDSLNEEKKANPLSWLCRIVFDFCSHSKHFGHWTIHTRSEAPPGSGLGGSSVLGVALYKALLKCAGVKQPKNMWDLQTRLRDLESAEMLHPAGEQDYVPALFGGLLIFHLGPQEKTIEKLPVKFAQNLKSRLGLLYTGKPHHSGLNNWQIFRSFHDGDARVRARLQNIRNISARLAADFRAGKLGQLANLVNEEWQERKHLSPAIAPPVIEEAWAFAKSQGAIACKACGAGGGGCLLVVFENAKAARAATSSTPPDANWRWIPM